MGGVSPQDDGVLAECDMEGSISNWSSVTQGRRRIEGGYHDDVNCHYRTFKIRGWDAWVS